MRRFGLALLLVLLLAAPASAALAVVQAVSCSGGGASSCTTAEITTTSGNLIVTTEGWNYNPSSFVSVTDSKSNTWTNAIPEMNDGAVYTYGRAEYNAAITGGSGHTFTFTGSTAGGSFYAFFGVVEISGQAASPLDRTASRGTSTFTTSHSTLNTATTTQAAEILVGFGSSIHDVTLTTDAGWTERVNLSPGAVGVFIMGTRIVAATGAYAYTWTSDAGAYDVQGIMTFKEATAAGGARPQCIGCGADRKVIE